MDEPDHTVFGGIWSIRLATLNTEESRAFYLAVVDEGELVAHRTYDELAEFAFETGQATSSWLVEFTVGSIKLAVEHCTALGASVVSENATTVTLVDARGVRFALTERRRASELAIRSGSVHLADLYTRDIERQVQFYARVFNLTVNVLPDDPVDYIQLSASDEHVLGLLDASSFLDRESPDQWLPYLSFGDVDAAVARATALGALVVVPATDSPTGRYAIIRDPQGVLVGFWDTASLLVAGSHVMLASRVN
jgi:predicted enzyme related to lactoylglutathione lyase